eukprot:4185848-Amphidinium_carterae.2
MKTILGETAMKMKADKSLKTETSTKAAMKMKADKTDTSNPFHRLARSTLVEPLLGKEVCRMLSHQVAHPWRHHCSKSSHSTPDFRCPHMHRHNLEREL